MPFITGISSYKEVMYWCGNKLLWKIQKLLYVKVSSISNFNLKSGNWISDYSCCSIFVLAWLWQANQIYCCYPNYAEKSAVRHLFLGCSTHCGVWLILAVAIEAIVFPQWHSTWWEPALSVISNHYWIFFLKEGI